MSQTNNSVGRLSGNRIRSDVFLNGFELLYHDEALLYCWFHAVLKVYRLSPRLLRWFLVAFASPSWLRYARVLWDLGTLEVAHILLAVELRWWSVCIASLESSWDIMRAGLSLEWIWLRFLSYCLLWRLFLYLFHLIVVQHIHKFLEDLLIFAVHAHIHILIILSKSFFFVFDLTTLPIGRRRDWSIIRLVLILCLLSKLFIGLEFIILGWSFTITDNASCGIVAKNIRFEETSDLPYVGWLQFLPIDGRIDCEIDIQEILRTVILVHSDVLELEVDFDVIIGEEGRELDELVSEIFDELIINIGDPCFQFDGDVLEEKVDALLFL